MSLSYCELQCGDQRRHTVARWIERATILQHGGLAGDWLPSPNPPARVLHAITRFLTFGECEGICSRTTREKEVLVLQRRNRGEVIQPVM